MLTTLKVQISTRFSKHLNNSNTISNIRTIFFPHNEDEPSKTALEKMLKMVKRFNKIHQVQQEIPVYDIVTDTMKVLEGSEHRLKGKV